MARVAWQNGCALGISDLRDWTLDGVHLFAETLRDARSGMFIWSMGLTPHPYECL